MRNTVNVTVKNVPAAVHKRLKARAVERRRSLNSEIIACLEAAVMPQALSSEEFLERIRALRTRVHGRLTEREITGAKREGRP